MSRTIKLGWLINGGLKLIFAICTPKKKKIRDNIFSSTAPPNCFFVSSLSDRKIYLWYKHKPTQPGWWHDPTFIGVKQAPPPSGSEALVHKILNLRDEMCTCSEQFARLAHLSDPPGRQARESQWSTHHTLVMTGVGDVWHLSLHVLAIPNEDVPYPLFVTVWCSIRTSLWPAAPYGAICGDIKPQKSVHGAMMSHDPICWKVW